MTGMGDALTVAILLTLIFGAIGFYLYSRLTQNEKRVSLLENLLLSLKINTEAELDGPSSIQPVSGPAPLDADDVDGVEETQYSELLRHIPTSTPPASPKTVTPVSESGPKEEAAAAKVLEEIASSSAVDVNYESMTLKELQSLGKERGLAVTGKRKPEVIEMLKRQGAVVGVPAPVPFTQEPLAGGDGTELEGPAGPNEGFQLNLDA